MKRSLLSRLQCPQCGCAELALENVQENSVEIESGVLRCPNCQSVYPILRYIPRFVSSANYATSFGFQWNHFRRTQLDSYSGVPVSRDRFIQQTRWTQEKLKNASALDAGCGAGRFAEIALSLGAEVVAVDYSSAVDACWQNLGSHPKLHVVQADIFTLPFRPGGFDFVYSLGVLQHTPDVKRALTALPAQLLPGGELAADLYLSHWHTLAHPKYFLRPITTRVQPDTLFGIIERGAPALLAVSRFVGRIPLVGRFLKFLVPVANYEGVYPLSSEQILEWAILDTYDWLSPRYDTPQTPAALRGWLTEAGLEKIEVEMAHHLTGRGRKSAVV